VRECVVVDTNVLVVVSPSPANRPVHVGPDCRQACVEFVKDLARDGILVLDQQMLIWEEYSGNISDYGLAHRTMMRLWQEGRVEYVPVEYVSDGGELIAELPPSLALDDFDRLDRKFVTVALGYEPRPPIVNAADSDWREHATAFVNAGIVIQELCPQEITGSDSAA